MSDEVTRPRGPWLFDTNVVLHLLRGKATAQRIERTVNLHAETNLTSRVVVGECFAFVAFQNWGEPKRKRMRDLLAASWSSTSTETSC